MLIRVRETASFTFYACFIMRMNRSPFTMHVAVLDACPLLIKGRMGSSGYIFAERALALTWLPASTFTLAIHA